MQFSFWYAYSMDQAFQMASTLAFVTLPLALRPWTSARGVEVRAEDLTNTFYSKETKWHTEEYP